MKLRIPLMLTIGMAAIAAFVLASVGSGPGAATTTVSAMGEPPLPPGSQRPDPPNDNDLNRSEEFRELRKVERAFERFIADHELSQVLANGVSTNVPHQFVLWHDFSVTPPEPLRLTQKYLRQEPTKCHYTWTVEGIVMQLFCDE